MNFSQLLFLRRRHCREDNVDEAERSCLGWSSMNVRVEAKDSHQGWRAWEPSRRSFLGGDPSKGLAR